jgi:hypothetical protein
MKWEYEFLDQGDYTMRQIDMTPYQPYKKLGASCHLRKIRDKKIIWPIIDHTDPDNPNFKLRGITRKDVAAVAELWRASYPEVYGSIHEWILRPEEYEERVAFAENWKEHSITRPHAVIVGEDLQAEKVVMASIYTKWDQNLQVEASFIAIHPDYRKGSISASIWSTLASFYKWLEDSGAEYVTVFCETWHNITQYIWFKRLGWKIAGIFPGNFTRWAGGQDEYRGCTIHFYRFLNDGEMYSTLPEEWDLLPEIKDLWTYMEKVNEQSRKEI